MIKFSTELSNVQLSSDYHGNPIVDSVRLGDLNYPLNNVSTSSVFGAWQDAKSGAILTDDDIIEDGSELIAINTAPVAVLEINGFIETNQITTFDVLPDTAPRRLVGTPVTKFSQLSWLPIGEIVVLPSGAYPFQGVSFNSEGGDIVDPATLGAVGNYLSEVTTQPGNEVATLVFYDQFFNDLKGVEISKAHMRLSSNGGKWEDGSSGPSSDVLLVGIKYGETLGQLLKRKNVTKVNPSKMTPPSGQHFVGYQYTRSGAFVPADNSPRWIDESSQIFPTLEPISSSSSDTFNVKMIWEDNASSEDDTPASLDLYDEDGDLLGHFDDIPEGTTLQDIMNGDVPGFDSNGDPLPDGDPLKTTSDKKLVDLSEDDVLAGFRFKKSDYLGEKPDAQTKTWGELGEMVRSDLHVGWSQLGQDPATLESPINTKNASGDDIGDDIVGQIVAGTHTLKATNKELTFDDVTLYNDDGFAVDLDWSTTFDGVKIDTLEHPERFNMGWATVESSTLGEGTTLDGGRVNPTTAPITEGPHEAVVAPQINPRPITNENPAPVTIKRPDGTEEPLVITPEDLGTPLDDLVGYDVPNYAIGNGYIVTTPDGVQHVVDGSTGSWSGGIGLLPGSTIEPVIIYPAGRFEYYGDANGGRYRNGSKTSKVLSGSDSVKLGTLSQMLPMPVNGLNPASGYNTTGLKEEPDPETVIQQGSTVYAYYLPTGLNAFRRYPREFYLVDRSTISTNPDHLDLFDLNDVKGSGSGVVMVDPEGLGFTVEDGQQITATLLFKGYNAFLKLSNWLNNKDVALYELNDSGFQNFVNVEIHTLTKSELTTKAVGYFEESVTFDKVGEWYDLKTLSDGVFSNDGHGLPVESFVSVSGAVVSTSISMGTSSHDIALTLQKLSDDGTVWEVVKTEHITVQMTMNLPISGLLLPLLVTYDSRPNRQTVNVSLPSVILPGLEIGEIDSVMINYGNSEPLVTTDGGSYRVQASLDGENGVNLSGYALRQRRII